MKKTEFLCVIIATGCLLLSACSQYDKISQQNPDPQNHETNSNQQSNKEDFEENYKTVDSCHGISIISNADESLFGVINSKGKEILPLEYDMLEIFNSRQMTSGLNDMVYIKAKQNEKYIVFDDNGKNILSTPYSVDFAEYAIGEYDNQGVYFIEYVTERANTNTTFLKTIAINFYDKNGKILSELTFDDARELVYKAIDVKFISKNLYLLALSTRPAGLDRIEEVKLYDMNNNVLQQWDNLLLCSAEGKDGVCYVTLQDYSNTTHRYRYEIDSNGNILSEKQGTIQELADISK